MISALWLAEAGGLQGQPGLDGLVRSCLKIQVIESLRVWLCSETTVLGLGWTSPDPHFCQALHRTCSSTEGQGPKSGSDPKDRPEVSCSGGAGGVIT